MPSRKRLIDRAWNNFPASACHIVRSNLFFLGHIPFLAGQTSIKSYHYKVPHPFTWCLNMKQVNFQSILLYTSIDLNAGKVERMVHAKSVSHLCIQPLLQFYILDTVSLSYEVDEIDWGLQSNWLAFTTRNTSRI